MKKLFALFCLLLLLCGCSAKYKNQDDEIVIALLDSGVSASAVESSHLREGYNYITGTNDTEDILNHGTAVASILLGSDIAEVKSEAPDAFVVPLVIVTEVDGKTTPASIETLAKAIRDSVDVYRADIINVSLGVQTDNTVLYEAVTYAEKNGVLVISAVGNDGKNGKPYYPAAYYTVLSVGSHDKNGNVSDFSQDGADVLAQGEDILLASKNGRKYGTKGTSYATGFVSATAANYLKEHPKSTPSELRNYLKTQQNFK